MSEDTSRFKSNGLDTSRAMRSVAECTFEPGLTAHCNLADIEEFSFHIWNKSFSKLLSAQDLPFGIEGFDVCVPNSAEALHPASSPVGWQVDRGGQKHA